MQAPSNTRGTILPDNFKNELARLSRAGFPLLPLGGGPDGKAPMVKDWAGSTLSLSRVLAPLYRSGSMVFAIRLDGLAVIDCDKDCPKLVASMEARFGASPVHVKTPRGFHLYYLAAGPVPNLRAEGLPVDIKTGAGAYVVGPGSMRRDGGSYDAVKGILAITALPPLRPSQRWPSATRATIPTGHRHNELVKEAIALVEYVDSAGELEANLAAFRADVCEDSYSISDAEVRSIADWAWQARLGNRIYKGRQSAFSLDRSALDALRRWENETDAISLYVLLQDMHGHSPGKRFALDFAAMRDAGLSRLSVKRLRAARTTLEAVGLLKLVSKHRAGSVPQKFSLCRLHPSAENVHPLKAIPTGGRV